MRFLVRLASPVVYQPDHPKARRTITELVVSASNPKDAEIHLYRSTLGPVQVLSVEEHQAQPPDPSPIEVPPVHTIAGVP